MFPEIDRISDLEEVRKNGSVVFGFNRVGYSRGLVDTSTRCVCMLIGKSGEKIPHVNYNDSRWRSLSSEKYEWTEVGGSSGSAVEVRIGKDSILANVVEESRESVWDGICSAQIALYFMVVEKVSSSYCGLTEFAVVPMGGKVAAVSTKNGVVNNRWVNEGRVVWENTLSGGDVCMVVVDLAQRLDSTTGVHNTANRVVWVTDVSKGKGASLYALDYWTGRTIAVKRISKVDVRVNAVAVNPENGDVWYVVPQKSGCVSVCSAKLIRSSGTISNAVAKNVSSPNAAYTKNYGMFPSTMSLAKVASRITGGRVSAGPNVRGDGSEVAGSSPWFTFIANREATISVSMRHPNVVRWADRSHFGAWHGINFSWGPRKYKYNNRSNKTKVSYKKNVEYGVSSNRDNLNGICCGIMGGVYVNGHPYYHKDDRVMRSFKYKGNLLNDTNACGRVFAKSKVYYPSYVIDPSTGEYKLTSSGKPRVVSKLVGETGFPVFGFHIAFPDDRTSLGWRAVEESVGTQEAKNKSRIGRHCRFGCRSKEGPKVSAAVASKYFHDDSGIGATLKNVNATWKTVTEHMSTETISVNDKSGSCWWQLQDVGLVYGANASVTKTLGKVYTSGVSDVYPYSTSYFFSTGVCEDNPLQLYGCGLPANKKWYDHRCNPPASASEGVSKTVDKVAVSGFAYQKHHKSDIENYFMGIVPDRDHAKSRPYSTKNGWAGYLEKPSTTSLYGSSEDWGVNKSGYKLKDNVRGAMVAYAEAGKPSSPKLSMCGIEETLPVVGTLDGDASPTPSRVILQTDVDGKVLYAIKYKSGNEYSGGSKNIVLSATLVPSGYQDMNVRGDSVFIDDENRIYVGSEKGMDLYSRISSPDLVKYRNSRKAEQFTSLGNHNNTGSRWAEAVLMYTSGILGGRTTTDIARSASAQVVSGMSGGDVYTPRGGYYVPWKTNGRWGGMNCDSTGMDSVKTLGYCFTLKTAAHPNVIYPSGHLLIVDNPTRPDSTLCDVVSPSGYWDKSVLEPSFLEDVDSEAARRHIADIVYPRDESAYERAASTLGTSAAAYQGAVTTHVLDVYPSGSMVIRSGLLKFFDGVDQNRGFEKVEMDVDVSLHPGASGYYAFFTGETGWNGITVFGKPLATTIDSPDNGYRKYYRWGQLTPSGDVWGMYPSVHPDRYTSSETQVRNSAKDDVFVEYNVGGTSAGFVSPNYVEFWVHLNGDVYADEIRSSTTDVKLGTNYVHVYERWSTPGFCPYVSSPESGREIFGVC